MLQTAAAGEQVEDCAAGESALPRARYCAGLWRIGSHQSSSCPRLCVGLQRDKNTELDCVELGTWLTDWPAD